MAGQVKKKSIGCLSSINLLFMEERQQDNIVAGEPWEALLALSDKPCRGQSKHVEGIVINRLCILVSTQNTI